MRILVLAPYLTRDQAGAAQAALMFANRLAREPWAETALFTYARDPETLSPAVRVIEGKPGSNPPFFWRFPSLYRSRQIRDEMVRCGVPEADVVYTQNMYMGMAYRQVHPKVPIISHTGAVITAREVREEWSAERWACSVEASLANSVEAATYKEKNWTHIVSTPLVAEAREQHFGLPQGFFRVCPYGIDPRRFELTGGGDVRKQLGIPESAFVVISIARLIEWKRIDMVMRAVGRLPGNVWHLIVGDGSHRQALEREAQQLGIANRVRFTGWTDPVPYLAAADLFALPSRIESFGVVYAEAMMSGLPCIGSRHRPPDVLSAAESVIPEGEAGYTVDNEEELGDRIDRLIRDKALYAQISSGARRIANSCYSTDHYLEVFQQCLTGESTPCQVEASHA